MAVIVRDIVIVGCGPGAPEYLLPAGLAAIERAQVLAGTSRLLATFAPPGKTLLSLTSGTEEQLGQLAAHVDHKDVAVLVTGDPGLCSLAALIIARFGRSRCRIIPGVSSVQVAFARVALDWRDAHIVTAHGRLPVETPAALAGHRKIAVLAGGDDARLWLCLLAAELGERYAIVLCSDLTLPRERVEFITQAALRDTALPSLSVVLFIDKGCLT